MTDVAEIESQAIDKILEWKEDWNLFAKEALGVTLDDEQQAILSSVQHNPRTSVASGTARGKDFVAAVAALCFMYLTPVWNDNGELIENTKVAMTAPTEPQVKNIMMPEISRLWNRAYRNGVALPGKLNAMDIRTDEKEWFLVGFKSDNNNTEAWSGFHAVNTMFVVTEASGISQTIFDAIEGNLQGNSRILIVFNPNSSVGYAAQSQKGERWAKFRLNSLTAPNVIQKKKVIPGQVDHNWVLDKVQHWCTPLGANEKPKLEEDDFEFECKWYRPNDLFRIKVLGKFPKVAEDVLIPQVWIEAAQQRWKKFEGKPKGEPKLGVDVAGMGRDSSVLCPRYENYVSPFVKMQSGGKADHMGVAGTVKDYIDKNGGKALIDTIGEGAGTFSRLIEQGYEGKAISCKYSEAAKGINEVELTDITGQYKFANMRAYLFWCVRDFLNPANETGAMLPPSETLLEEASEIKWKFRSDGRIIIEPKEDIKKRLGRSTDEFDALANTFYPVSERKMNLKTVLSAFGR